MLWSLEANLCFQAEASQGLVLTVSGLQAVGETQGQVALGEELPSLLSKVDHHHGKVFRLLQLQRGEAEVTGDGLLPWAWQATQLPVCNDAG